LTKKWSEGIDILLVLDVSESMEATDFAPDRITVAKAVVRDFIRKRTEDRIGLVVFGGEAMTKCPLTRDYDFLLAQVEDIRLRELKQGTAIGMALANGVGRLRGSKAKTRIIVLLTDGDSNVGAINPVTAATLARQEGIKIYTIGIGKQNRVVVPIYSYDSLGRRGQLIAQVPSYLNPELLKEIARITGGKAYMARDPGSLARILQEIDGLEKTKVQTQISEKKEDAFMGIALIALSLLVALFTLQETHYRKARLATSL
jgi:Ca-activated chloride channel family protein